MKTIQIMDAITSRGQNQKRMIKKKKQKKASKMPFFYFSINKFKNSTNSRLNKKYVSVKIFASGGPYG